MYLLVEGEDKDSGIPLTAEEPIVRSSSEEDSGAGLFSASTAKKGESVSKHKL